MVWFVYDFGTSFCLLFVAVVIAYAAYALAIVYK